MNLVKIIFTLIIIIALDAFSENSGLKEGFPQQGMIAAMGIVQPGVIAVPPAVGMAPGKIPPITGSVNKPDKSKWRYSITNNFERTVKIKFTLEQFGALARPVSSSQNSFLLKKNETKSGEVLADQSATGCAILMQEWKFISK